MRAPDLPFHGSEDDVPIHVPWHKSLRSIGAGFDMGKEDLNELNEGTERVYKLMRDGEWHSREAICLAAGQGGVPASEGLRRMRALRLLFLIGKERVGEPAGVAIPHRQGKDAG